MSNQTHSEFSKNLALAGVCQAAALVKQIARSGELNQKAFAASIRSITVTDPKDTIEVFGSLDEVYLGYSTLINQLSNDDSAKDVEITRYVANILALERKVSSKPKVLQQLSERISQIQRQALHLELLDGQMLSNLAAVYSDVISPVSRKIQIAGNPSLLKRTDNQHKVRAILLAGLRAAVLWRQLSGKRRQILFSRKHIVDAARSALNQTSSVN